MTWEPGPNLTPTPPLPPQARTPVLFANERTAFMRTTNIDLGDGAPGISLDDVTLFWRSASPKFRNHYDWPRNFELKQLKSELGEVTAQLLSAYHRTGTQMPDTPPVARNEWADWQDLYRDTFNESPDFGTNIYKETLSEFFPGTSSHPYEGAAFLLSAYDNAIQRGEQKLSGYEKGASVEYARAAVSRGHIDEALHFVSQSGVAGWEATIQELALSPLTPDDGQIYAYKWKKFFAAFAAAKPDIDTASENQLALIAIKVVKQLWDDFGDDGVVAGVGQGVFEGLAATMKILEPNIAASGDAVLIADAQLQSLRARVGALSFTTAEMRTLEVEVAPIPELKTLLDRVRVVPGRYYRLREYATEKLVKTYDGEGGYTPVKAHLSAFKKQIMALVRGMSDDELQMLPKTLSPLRLVVWDEDKDDDAYTTKGVFEEMFAGMSADDFGEQGWDMMKQDHYGWHHVKLKLDTSRQITVADVDRALEKYFDEMGTQMIDFIKNKADEGEIEIVKMKASFALDRYQAPAQ